MKQQDHQAAFLACQKSNTLRGQQLKVIQGLTHFTLFVFFPKTIIGFSCKCLRK